MQYPARVRNTLRKTAGRLRDGDDTGIAGRVGLAAGAFFAWTALPGLHGYDAAEFAAVGWRLSLSHPPGHPVHALLTKAAQMLIPVGDLAFRANLLGAIVVGAALAMLYRLLRLLAPDVRRWVAAEAALMLAVVPLVWLQAVRAEVYGLQLLFTVSCGWLALRLSRGEGRALPALALTFGLAGANHSYIGLFMVPLALWAMAVGLRRAGPGERATARPIAWAVPAGLLGLLAYLYLPLRATAGGIVGWGRPDTLDGFVGTITARDWTRGLAPPADNSALDNIGTLVGFAIEQTGPIAAAVLFGLLLAGAPFIVQRRRLIALAALVGVALPVASRVIYPLDLANPDLGGYLAGAAAAALCLLLVAIDALPDTARRWSGLLLPIPLLLMALDLDGGRQLRNRSVETVARARLAEVPPDGHLISSDYATAFQTWGLRALYGARPDVAPIFRGRVDTDWHRSRLRAAHPAAAEALADFPRGFDTPASRYEPGVEMHRLGPLEARLRPVGLTLAPDMDWPTPEALTAALQPLERFSDRDARRQAAFVYAQHAAHMLRVEGPPELIGWMLDRAWAIAPGDPLLVEMRQAAGR